MHMSYAIVFFNGLARSSLQRFLYLAVHVVEGIIELWNMETCILWGSPGDPTPCSKAIGSAAVSGFTDSLPVSTVIWQLPPDMRDGELLMRDWREGRVIGHSVYATRTSVLLEFSTQRTSWHTASTVTYNQAAYTEENRWRTPSVITRSPITSLQ